jgi:DNA (cytosine-5)-methyltransferase 1
VRQRGSRRVVELFAGVGGFRVGLRAAGWKVVWANQWEPATKAQHAFETYRRHFRTGTHSNEDIGRVAARVEAGSGEIPEYELLCGGFPCQDYSVARTSARGIEGKKGVLWWEIERLVRSTRPPFVLLENVDRLLKSPAGQRGRDFAIILSCLANLGYAVEWRVVNAADYGLPQRRRRVFILARPASPTDDEPFETIQSTGVLAKALPVYPSGEGILPMGTPIAEDLVEVTARFGRGSSRSPFENAGFMRGFEFWTLQVEPRFRGKRKTLRDALDKGRVPAEYYIPEQQLAEWRYLKGAKREPRTNRSGFSYEYTEGAIAFPDPLDMPSRTILTGEGGPSPSRFKHVIRTGSGRYRRLTPTELERLNGFRPGWTEGMPPSRRAFMMGNALVVGIVRRIGRALDARADELLANAPGGDRASAR